MSTDCKEIWNKAYEYIICGGGSKEEAVKHANNMAQDWDEREMSLAESRLEDR